MCGISFWLMTLLNGEIKFGDDGVQGIAIIVGGAAAGCCMAMIGSIQKWSLCRKIQKRIADSDWIQRSCPGKRGGMITFSHY